MHTPDIHQHTSGCFLSSVHVFCTQSAHELEPGRRARVFPGENPRFMKLRTGSGRWPGPVVKSRVPSFISWKFCAWICGDSCLRTTCIIRCFWTTAIVTFIFDLLLISLLSDRNPTEIFGLILISLLFYSHLNSHKCKCEFHAFLTWYRLPLPDLLRWICRV